MKTIKTFSFRTGEHKYATVPHPHGGEFAAWKAQDGPGPQWNEGWRHGKEYSPDNWEYEAYQIASGSHIWPVVRDSRGRTWEFDGSKWRKTKLPTSDEMIAVMKKSKYVRASAAILLRGKRISEYAMIRLDPEVAAAIP